MVHGFKSAEIFLAGIALRSHMQEVSPYQTFLSIATKSLQLIGNVFFFSSCHNYIMNSVCVHSPVDCSQPNYSGGQAVKADQCGKTCLQSPKAILVLRIVILSSQSIG